MKANADHGFREGLFVSLGFFVSGFNKLRVVTLMWVFLI
ncbi:MAG: hypothetical protein CM1200mP3_13310 [Chloroflexota bacterium]|nr:MAG: hypothetical protein CM1200mP3_13310 [Chloroflexota bacterium]